jgi:predicted enzyme related to lactoylglutathione lyase
VIMAKATAKNVKKATAKQPVKPTVRNRASLKATLVDTPPRRTNKAKQAALRKPTGPVFRGLRTVIYPVTDLVRARTFYIGVTGKAPYFDQPYYVGFDIEGAELGLDPKGARSPGASGAVAYWRVDDIAASLAHVTELGGTAMEAPHDVGGGIQVAIVTDPFANLIGLIEMP